MYAVVAHDRQHKGSPVSLHAHLACHDATLNAGNNVGRVRKEVHGGGRHTITMVSSDPHPIFIINKWPRVTRVAGL